MTFILAGLVMSYLLGSIPTAYLFGLGLKGIDIRQHGSGNVGATNAFRVLGKGVGAVVLILDIIKGMLAIIVVGNVLSLDRMTVRILLGVMVVVGHNWTIFLGFKGGKGIATSLGVLIGLTIQYQELRWVLLITIGVWIVSFLLSRYVSLSSLLAALALPIAMMVTRQSHEMLLLGVLFCVFIVIRHISNIKRLLAGQEKQIRFSIKKSS